MLNALGGSSLRTPGELLHHFCANRCAHVKRRLRDLFAAKKAGFVAPARLPRSRPGRVCSRQASHSFKTAWVSYEEYIPCETMWGTPDIIAKDLEEAALEIIRREGNSS